MTHVGMFYPMLDQAARVLAAPSSPSHPARKSQTQDSNSPASPGAGRRAGLELSCEAFFWWFFPWLSGSCHTSAF